jgi:hypothetical protein
MYENIEINLYTQWNAKCFYQQGGHCREVWERFFHYFHINTFEVRKENARLILRIEAVDYPVAGQQEMSLVST